MKNAIAATLLGGLAAGGLDIIYAFIVYGPLAPAVGLSSSLSPQTVLQSVAGGWIGRDAAFDGGLNTALLGAVTHFGIAIVMAGVFVALLGRVGAKSPLLLGVLYGIVLFVAMNYLVVPLSAAATGQFASSADDAMDRIQHAVSNALQFKRPLLLAGTIFTHTVLVGVPIALIAKRFNAQQA